MKAYSISDIKKELARRPSAELLSFCLRMAKFKKENKELLAFLLFDADNTSEFIEHVKEETTESFSEINKSNVYFIKKSVRKILRNINKNVRFISSKQSEAELLIHFCNCINNFEIPVNKSRQLKNLNENQQKKIEEIISSLHPDLQYDLKRMQNW